jgi:hypothetical protein
MATWMRVLGGFALTAPVHDGTLHARSHQSALLALDSWRAQAVRNVFGTSLNARECSKDADGKDHHACDHHSVHQ